MNRASIYVLVVIADLAILHSSLQLVRAQTNGGTTHGFMRTVHAAFPSSPGSTDEGYFAWGWPVRQKETIRKSFAVDAAHPIKTIEVDAINGSIEVVGGESDQVQMVVNETIRAESKEDAEKALKEVTLDVTQPGDSLRLYVDGPFRRDRGDGIGSYEDEGYDVGMDFVLNVPRDMNLRLKTVNAGDISVKDVSGHYSIRDVNGRVEMLHVAGSGEVHTVNGDVTVVFRENPTEDSDFGSVNGRIELSFLPNLSADLRLATFNGGVYSDFPLNDTAAQGGEEANAFAMFPGHRHTSTRIGSGGPQINAETISGDIRVLKNHE